VSRFSDAPELGKMILRVESFAQQNNDRRLYMRSVREIFPQPYRETSGVTAAHAAKLLLMGFLLSGAVEKFRKRSDRVCINFPAGRKSYSTFDQFMTTVTVREEQFLHNGWWNQLAMEPDEILQALENLNAGKADSEEGDERREAMKRWVGATRWNEAIETLLQQANVAKQYL
jgi:hypothetical protein